MGLLGKNSLTITDITDVNPIRLDLASSQPIYQTKRAGAYEPDYNNNPLIITPSLYFGIEEVSKEKYKDKITFFINGVQVNNTETIYIEDAKLYIKENLTTNTKIEVVIKNIIDDRTNVEYKTISESLSFYLLSYDSSGYTVFIDSNDGRYDFSATNSNQITLRAHLYLGAAELDTVIYEWKKSSNPDTVIGENKEIVIERKDIYSHENFICTITCEGVSYVAACAIDDRTDLYSGTIISDAPLVMTPNFNIANLTCKIFKNGEEVNIDGSAEIFSYSWLLYQNEDTSGISIGETKNISIELGKNAIPKDSFTIYCVTKIDNKYTVVSYLPISYSVSYTPVLSPKTIFISADNSGLYNGIGDSIEKTLIFFLQGEDGTPIEAELSNFSINGVDYTATKIDNKYSIPFSLSVEDFNLLETSSMFELSYRYKEKDFNEEFYIVKNIQGQIGESGASYSLILSNDYYRFAGKEVYAIGGQEVSTRINFFKGDEELPLEVIKIGDRTELTTEAQTIVTGLQAKLNQAGSSTNKIITFITLDRLLKEGGIIPIEIKVKIKEEEKIFATVFQYDINYEGNSYFLSFSNGTSISYFPSKNIFSPNKIEFYVYYRKNGSGENIPYTEGQVYVSIDEDSNKTKLTSASAFYSYSLDANIKSSITFYLYSSVANENAPEESYLMDRETIPILTSLEGTEIGGDNLIKFSRTLEQDIDKWNYKYGIADEIQIIEEDGFNNANFNFSYDTSTNNNGNCYIISPAFFIDKEIRDKNLCFSFYFKINSEIESAKKQGNDIYFSILGYDNTNNLLEESGHFSIFNIKISDDKILENNQWIRLYEIFKANILENININYFKIKIGGLISIDDEVTNYDFNIKKPKLEIGNIPTAWSSAADDIIFEGLSINANSLNGNSIIDLLKEQIKSIQLNSNSIGLIQNNMLVNITDIDGNKISYTNLQDLYNYLNTNINTIIELQNNESLVINTKLDTISSNLDGLYKLQNKIELGYDDNNKKEPYMLFDVASGENGVAHNYSMKLTPKRLSFLSDNKELAYFGNTSLTIERARIKEGIYLGSSANTGYLVIKTTEQGCAFMWDDDFNE